MRPIRVLVLARFLLFALIALPFSAGAQTTVVLDDWETLRPDGEEFTILMPKNSSAATSKEPYHKIDITTRLYLSNQPAGVFAVASMSGIKANSALYSQSERLNSYVDAFKHWFPRKVRGEDAAAKLTLVGDKTLNGHMGREYRLNIGDLSGVAQFYATRKRFYAIIVLNVKNGEQVKERFLSSFVLPQKLAEAPAVATQKKEAPAEPEPAANSLGQKPESRPVGAEGLSETATETKPGEPAAQTDQAAKRVPISGGVLNGKAISLPKPDYPAEARSAKASGTVVVQVTIDEYGNVVTARAVSGNPLLYQVSVNAALQAKFSPTSLMGEPVKVAGVITYNFVAP